MIGNIKYSDCEDDSVVAGCSKSSETSEFPVGFLDGSRKKS